MDDRRLGDQRRAQLADLGQYLIRERRQRARRADLARRIENAKVDHWMDRFGTARRQYHG